MVVGYSPAHIFVVCDQQFLFPNCWWLVCVHGGYVGCGGSCDLFVVALVYIVGGGGGGCYLPLLTLRYSVCVCMLLGLPLLTHLAGSTLFLIPATFSQCYHAPNTPRLTCFLPLPHLTFCHFPTDSLTVGWAASYCVCQAPS